MTTTKWTHTATLDRTAWVGPSQDRRMILGGTRVEVFQDPAKQAGWLITIRVPGFTGVTAVDNLIAVQAK
jgi:hypothetical protein